MKLSDLPTAPHPAAGAERTVAHTLDCGISITLRAWKLSELSAHVSEFGQLLRLSAGLISAPEDAGEDARLIALSERVITMSLVHPEDARHIEASDIADLLETIMEFNRLRGFLKKMVGLFLAMSQDRAELLEAVQELEEASATPNSVPDTE